jgi:tetratricopeptide (TPR) repeat protein
MKTLMLLCLVAHLTMVGLANAQEKATWLGRRVFTKYGTVLRVGGRVVDDEGRTASLRSSGRERAITRVYRVEGIQGEWLWLQDEKSGISGWVRSRFVIPYERAVDYFTNHIRANPQWACYVNRGDIWMEKGEYDIAISDFNEAIRLEPGDATPYCCRGIAWVGKKEYDKAIADSDEAIRIEPRFALAYYNRGVAWRSKAEYDKAISDFSKAIPLDPTNASVFNSRGSVRGIRSARRG